MSSTKIAYEKVTAAIVAALEKGVAPWRKPWKGQRPSNLVSKKPYRGVNILLTRLAPFGSPWWMTFNQAKDLGGFVKKGEKATPIVFWSVRTKDRLNEQGQPTKDKFFVLRYYSIFNLDQVEGIDPKKVPAPVVQEDHDPIEQAEIAVERYFGDGGPSRTVGGDVACYYPGEDRIRHPGLPQFESPETYYSTLFHECVHSTGHEKRLKRDLSGFSGSHAYSFEELIAELGSAFLCEASGVSPPIEHSAAYLKSWASKLKENEDWIVKASSKAQKAANLVLGVAEEKYEDESSDEATAPAAEPQEVEVAA